MIGWRQLSTLAVELCVLLKVSRPHGLIKNWCFMHHVTLFQSEILSDDDDKMVTTIYKQHKIA